MSNGLLAFTLFHTAISLGDVVSLYLNFFVLIVQAFQKVPALHSLAPTQSQPPFQGAQIAALVLFIVLGFLSWRRFRVAG